MHLLMSWPFWALFHGSIAATVAGTAMYAGRRWTALFASVGTIAGVVLAVVPLWLLMRHFERSTGYDAGNAGVFFVCTVPVFPLVGLALGALVGLAIDSAPKRSAMAKGSESA